MTAVNDVLVVGAGTAGVAAATFLADAGVAVDLVEINSDVTALGSGVTLQGNALRVLRQLGVLDECFAAGWPSDGLKLRSLDGAVIGEHTELRTGGPDLPATLGMYRPDLARILMNRATGAGVKAQFSTTIDAIEQDRNGVDVRFSNGSAGRYDLVIGADGIRSQTRSMVQIPLETRSIGLAVWRLFVPRPAEITTSEATVGGPVDAVGVTPTSDTHMYAFLVEAARDLTSNEKAAALRGILADYHGPWDEIRDSITDATQIHYTRFEEHLLDPPWHRGRVTLIGDAAHVCPPTLAQGVALGLEDAAVLAELLLAAQGVDDDLLNRFTNRRFARVKSLVEASVRLAHMQLGGDQADFMAGVALMAESAELTSQPA